MDDAWQIDESTDGSQVIERAARRVMETIAAAIDARGRCTLALAGGGTPRSLYRLLSSDALPSQVDWSRVDFFWGDERCVPPESEESNYRMARESLLEPLGVEPSRIHRMPAERDDVRRAADDYQREIAECFATSSTGAPPRFDLVLLGMGDDGHTASLFPHTAALSEKERWVAANEVPQLSTTRMTMTAPLINRARTILFLVIGAGKAAALADVLEGPRDPQRLPSQLIQPVDGQMAYYVDAAAAGMLKRTARR